MNADVSGVAHPSTPDDIHANPSGFAHAERAPPTVLDPSDALNVRRPSSCEEFFIRGPAKSWAARKQVPGENTGVMAGRFGWVSAPRVRSSSACIRVHLRLHTSSRRGRLWEEELIGVDQSIRQQMALRDEPDLPLRVG
jgi:hypothetical protein